MIVQTHDRTERRRERTRVTASRHAASPASQTRSVDEAVRLRRRLLSKAPLFDEAVAYAAGVDDALTACAQQFGIPELLDALDEPGFPIRF